MEALSDYEPTASQAELMHLLDAGSSRSFASSAVAGLGDRAKQRQLVRVLSEDDELQSLSTPTGFLLTGPPGTGCIMRGQGTLTLAAKAP